MNGGARGARGRIWGGKSRSPGPNVSRGTPDAVPSPSGPPPVTTRAVTPPPSRLSAGFCLELGYTDDFGNLEEEEEEEESDDEYGDEDSEEEYSDDE